MQHIYIYRNWPVCYSLWLHLIVQNISPVNLMKLCMWQNHALSMAKKLSMVRTWHCHTKEKKQTFSSVDFCPTLRFAIPYQLFRVITIFPYGVCLHILSFNVNPLSLRFVLTSYILHTHLTLNYYMVGVDRYATARKCITIVLLMMAQTRNIGI